jgi:hypothetical protein
MKIVDQKRFNILHYKDKYRMQKKCSITDKLYYVDLSVSEYVRYYTQKGKSVNHLDRLTEEEKLFLQTTCTPQEINSLSDMEKKLSKKIWRFRLKLK